MNGPLIVSHPSLDASVRTEWEVMLISTYCLRYCKSTWVPVRTDNGLPRRSLLDNGPEWVVFSVYGPPVVATNALITNTERVVSQKVDDSLIGLQVDIAKEQKLVKKSTDPEELYRRCDENQPIDNPKKERAGLRNR